jgi:EmrB/QacA subfamily drug resistance transporter
MNRNRWTLVAVGLATFMTYLDNNIVNVAIPDIQHELGLSTAGIEWVVSGYILTFAGLLLAGGRLADAFGRRRLFVVGLAVFTGASLFAGLAGGAGTLIAARALQGIGAAAVTPTTLAIISATFTDPRERNAAVGIWGGVGALALAVGPVLGGFLTQHVSWEWIFWINVPVGIATIALGAWAIRESREDEARRLDMAGLALSTVSLFALTWALIEGHDRGWTSTGILGSFAMATGAALAFVVVER